MLRAEVAHLVCEQIARGGLTRVPKAPSWHEPMRYSGETEEAFSTRRRELRVKHLDSQARALSVNAGNLEACKRAARDLDAAGQHGEAAAIREHVRTQWGRFAASEAA
jgi:hypothetical protein